MKDALGHGSNAHNAGIEQIPPKGANELKMFGDNDGTLYRNSQKYVENNLDKKIDKGVYDHGLATKLWGYHADRAAQSYNRQMPDRPGQKWNEQFPPNVRQAAAKQWADEFKGDRQSRISAGARGQGHPMDKKRTPVQSENAPFKSRLGKAAGHSYLDPRDPRGGRR